MDWLGTIVSGAGSLLDSLLGTGLSISSSKKLMQYQAQLNQQGIDTANRYNLPINQLSRLRDAGLNANLVYGNGQVAGLTSDGASSTNQGLKQMNFNSGLTPAVNYALQSKQAEQSVKESHARELSYLASAEKVGKEIPYLDEYFKQRINNMYADESYTRTREQLAEIEKANAAELTKLYAARTGLTNEQARNEIKRRFVMEAQIRLMNSNDRLNEKQIEWLAERILNTKQDTENKSLWHQMQEAEFNSSGALKQFLANHSNWAIFYGILKDIFKSGVVSPW